MSSIAIKRLNKEIKELLDPEKGPPVGIKLLNADDLKIWTLSIEVLGESVYQGDVFALRFTFTDRYPMESPEVVFVVNEEYQAPIHPHVYSNGHICASILGKHVGIMQEEGKASQTLLVLDAILIAAFKAC